MNQRGRGKVSGNDGLEIATRLDIELEFVMKLPLFSLPFWCLLVALTHLAEAVPVQQAYVKASNPQNTARFARSVAISGNTMVIGANNESSSSVGVNGAQNNIGADKSGAAYVFVRTGNTWTQQAFLKASNSEANDNFGISVAISGNTIVVGSYYEDGGSPGVNGNQADNSSFASGAAYVFHRTGTTWTQQAYLKASHPGSDDYFGCAVAISGNTIVVGASDEDSNAVGVNGDASNNLRFNSGAAYVFQRTGSTWAQQAYLKAGNADNIDYFGSAVAISGDTIVVGTEFEASNATTVNGNGADNSATKAGAAYVFQRTGTTWAQQAYLKAHNTGANDLFGRSVAVHGNTVVVGAPGESSNATTVNGNGANNSASNAGAAYVFLRTGTTWAQQAYLKASNAEMTDLFGSSVAVSLDGIAVGAPNEASNATGINGSQTNNSQSLAGAVYLYSRSGITWNQQAYVKASNTDGYDEFGDRVALSGSTLVVGAMMEASNSPGVNGNQENDGLSAAGAAYVFTGVPGAAAPDIRLTGVSRSGNNMTVLFSSAPGLSSAGWQVEGSPDLQEWPDLLNSVTTITELTAGNYRAVVNVTGKPASKYFLRIAR